MFKLESNGRPVYTTNTNAPSWPINDLCFQERNAAEGWSFVFGDKDDPTKRPYVQWKAAHIANDGQDEDSDNEDGGHDGTEKLDNGQFLPTKLYFDEGCHFFDKANTFHGTVTFGNDLSFRGSSAISWILQFSSDKRFVSAGAMTHHIDVDTNHGSGTGDYDKTKIRKAFPLDGKWKVVWNDDESGAAELTVRANRFSHFMASYEIQVHARPIRFVWPPSHTDGNLVTHQELKGGWNPDTNPEGPAIGDTIEWSIQNDGRIRKITWVSLDGIWASFPLERTNERMNRLPPAPTNHLLTTPFVSTHVRVLSQNETIRHETKQTRQTIVNEVPSTLTVQLGGPGTMYERSRTLPADARLPPVYNAEGLWGNTFCQATKVGLASYHFAQTGLADGAYISYENPLCSEWPSLDDGSPVPSRVQFHDISYNEEERIFRGSICWEEDYGTTWQGCRKWMYKMKFDERFSFIVSGSVQSLYPHSEDAHDMSTFGLDLIYVNAAVEEYFGAVLDTELTDDDMEQHNTEFQALSQHLRSSWVNQGASVRTIAMMHKLLTFIVAQETNPIDFNL